MKNAYVPRDARNTTGKRTTQPVIQCDYAYLTFGDSQSVTLLTTVDVATSMSMAVAVQQKGATKHAVTELRRFVLEVGRAYGVLQSDQEPAIKALLQATAKELGGLSVRTTPAYSSQSQNSVERFHQTLYGQVRAFQLHLKRVYGIEVSYGSPIMHALGSAPRSMVHQPLRSAR